MYPCTLSIYYAFVEVYFVATIIAHPTKDHHLEWVIFIWSLGLHLKRRMAFKLLLFRIDFVDNQLSFGHHFLSLTQNIHILVLKARCPVLPGTLHFVFGSVAGKRGLLALSVGWLADGMLSGAVEQILDHFILLSDYLSELVISLYQGLNLLLIFPIHLRVGTWVKRGGIRKRYWRLIRRAEGAAAQRGETVPAQAQITKVACLLGERTFDYYRRHIWLEAILVLEGSLDIHIWGVKGMNLSEIGLTNLSLMLLRDSNLRTS